MSKPYISLFLLAVLLLAGCAQQIVPTETAAPAADEGGFDEVLATKLGADDYGMSRYVIAFLYAGENRDRDSTEAVELQRAHLKNIRRMADEGTLVMAGPFLDQGDLRGIYIFDVATIEEAQALTESDPAIQAGSLRMELRPWYGSAAIKHVSEIHDRIRRIKF